MRALVIAMLLPLVASCSVLFSAEEGALDAGTGIDRDSGGVVIPPGEVWVWSGSSAQHTCASKGAQVVCWGDNSFGQLGVGNRDPRLSAVGLQPITLPTNLSPSNVRQMALGYAHTCALLENGRVHCWGSNQFGQLGTKDGMDRATPIAQAVNVGPEGQRATSISAGPEHTCAVMETDEMRCWGNVASLEKPFGLVGEDFIWGDDEYPEESPAIPLPFEVHLVSLGAEHGCAVSKEGTDIQCWGTIDGDGDQLSAPISDGIRITQLVAGNDFNCLLDTMNNVNCWGNNDHGQVGRPGAGYVMVPPDEVLSFGDDLAATQVAVSAHHSCALFNNGTLRCWGRGLFGATGLGSIDNVGQENLALAPTSVNLGAPVVSLATGAFHTCVALESGAVRCFGTNKFNQLGTGTTCEELGGDGDLCNYGDAADEPLDNSGLDLLWFD